MVVAKAGTVIIMSIFVLTIFFLGFEAIFLPWECAEALLSIEVGRKRPLIIEEGRIFHEWGGV